MFYTSSMQNSTFTTGDIAKYCQVNFRTVIRWIDRGLLKAYKLPGRGDNRVRQEDLLTFLHENKMPVPTELTQANNRILIVEDDPVTAKILEMVLQKAEFETSIAPSGFHAGVLLGEFSPDLVTLDLDIPGLSGLEVLRYIRKTDGLKHIKVLVISSMEQSILDEAAKEGADAVLSKPVNPSEVDDAIKKLRT
jgi:two-component system, OmpR family, response regulator VicR